MGRKKGNITIDCVGNRIRMRWRYQGRSHALYPGFDCNEMGEKAAERLAFDIKRDMELENFDLTLKRYRLDQFRQPEENPKSIRVLELYEQVMGEKEKFCDSRTLEIYKHSRDQIDTFFGDVYCDDISEKDAIEFWLFLSEGRSERRVKDYLSNLKTVFRMGIEEGLILNEHNPWVKVLRQHKVPPKQKPDPFTHEEMNAILEAFQNHDTYCYYYPYLAFLFFTGCRVGEAKGLLYRHLESDFSKAWIGESLNKNQQRKAAKNYKSRTIQLDKNLIEILKTDASENPEPEMFVFRQPRGKAINEGNFRNRAWQPILGQLGIPYRMPRSTRHTFITLALYKGHNPYQIAQHTGHDAQTLFSEYAAYIDQNLVISIQE